MKTRRPLVLCVVATAGAILTSLALIEEVAVHLACCLVGAIGLAIALLRCIAGTRPLWRTVTDSVLPAFVFVAVAWPHFPLRLSFDVYQSQFEHVASQIEAGDAPTTPFWIGPFRIRTTGSRDGTPYLGLNQEDWEVDGFVRHPEGDGFNLWSSINLNQEWSYVCED